MACGVVPIAADHSGLRDGLEALRDDLPREVWRRMKLETENDQRVRSVVDNVSELVELLSRHPDLPSCLRSLAEQRYDWRAVAQQLIEVASARRRAS